jgi:hypothetical protein
LHGWFWFRLVCFGLPVDSLKYEDTTGRPRNDEDSAEWSGATGLRFWGLRCVGCSLFFRDLRHDYVITARV